MSGAALLLIGGVLVGLVVVCVLCLLAARYAGSATPVRPVVYKATTLMTPSELQTFQKLVVAVPAGIIVAPQVAMSALVDAETSEGQRNRNAARGKISQKRLDFVLFEHASGKVRLIIEQDDKTHDTARQKSRDAERDALLTAVGYKVVRFDIRKAPDMYKFLQDAGL